MKKQSASKIIYGKQQRLLVLGKLQVTGQNRTQQCLCSVTNKYYLTHIFDSSIFEDAKGKQFRIKKNKNGSVSSLEIEVINPSQKSMFIEVLKGGEIIKTPFFGNERWTNYWLPKEDILEAIPQPNV